MDRIRAQVGILCLLSGLALPTAAAENAGTESPLNAPTSARALSLGGTAVAMGEGAENLAHNPARLAWLSRGSVSLYHTSLYSDQTSLNSGFAAYPTVDFGTFAAGIQRLGVGGIDGRDDRNLPVGSFDVSELHASVGYGRAFEPWLSGGLALRIVQQSVGEASATAAGLDLGLAVQRELPWPGHRLHVGLAAQNLVQPNLRLDEEEVADPTRTRVGLGYGWNPPTRRLHATAAVEWTHSPEADARWGAGLEVGFDQLLFLRGGVDDGELTAGIGVRMRGLDFSYATRDDRNLPRDDRFTVAYRYGPTVAQRLRDRRTRQEEAVSRRLESLLRSKEQQALERAREEAAEAWAAGDLEQIEVLYRRVLLLAPEDSLATARIDDARRRRALRSATEELHAGAPARAATRFQRVLDQWPGDETAADGLTEARRRIARDEDRRGQVRELFSDALARFAADDVLGARAALDELMRLEPEHEGARELSLRVEAEWARRVEDLVSRAERAGEDERYSEAIELLGRARRLAPDRSPEFDTRMSQWSRLREQRRSELASTPAPSPPPSAASTPAPDREELQERFSEGMRHFESGRYERATRAWRDVWELDPRYRDVGGYLVKAHLLLGIQAYTGGDYPRALEHCRRALEIEPRNEKAQRYLARIEEERTSVRQFDEWSSGE